MTETLENKTKFCKKCGTWKEITEFSYRNKTKGYRQNKCKECNKRIMAEYHEVNPFVNTPEIADKRKSHYIQNRVRILADKRDSLIRRKKVDPLIAERERISHSKSKKNNKGKINADTAKRRAAKLLATPGWADLKKIEWFYEEAERISIETGIPHHVDHDAPLISDLVCGLHCEANLRIIPASENLKKGNRTWTDMS